MARCPSVGGGERPTDFLIRSDWQRRSMANPSAFFRQVRQEAAKVTWPTRKETGITTLMVFVMVALAAIFFLVVDQILALAVRFILGLGA
jgi:preprotein translocase subunit SecE